MKAILFANTDWYLFNFRLPLARALRAQGYEVLLLSPPGRYTAQMEAEGFRWLPFHLQRKGINPLTELGTISRLVNVYRHEKPDVVHHFTIKPVLYGSIAARLVGIKRILNAVTGLGFAFSEGQRLLQMIVGALYRLSLSQTRVIFQNPADQEVFLQNKLAKPGQTLLIPGSGVDTKIFRFVPEPPGPPIVMLAARLLRPKGIPEFVEAAKRIQREEIPARFVLVGEPDFDNPEAVSQEELSGWEQKKWIEHWGWRDNMPEVISQAAIFCLPTTYKEGLPKTLLEAASSGRPIVATDIPGCRMIVRDEENGFLVKPHDVDDLVDKLIILLKQPALRHQMGIRGREIVEHEFSAEIIIAQTLRAYE